MNRLAIFDCDGTLVDSQHNICLAMEDCFASVGLEPPCRERTRRVVGLSLIEAIRAMLPEAEDGLHLALAEEYKRSFQAMRARGLAQEPLYAGVKELTVCRRMAGCSASRRASRTAGWPFASTGTVCSVDSSRSRPPTVILPSRIRR